MPETFYALREYAPVRDGGNVKRYHTRPTIGQQTVAEHSWNCAALLLALHPFPSRALLVATLLHDVAEAKVGDIPAPVKDRHPALAGYLAKAEEEETARMGLSLDNITSDEEVWLLFVDKLERLHYCIEQRLLGNRGAATWWAGSVDHTATLLQELTIRNEDTGAAQAHLLEVQRNWAEINGDVL